MSRFKQGQVITLKSDKSITGAIVNISEGYPETKYQVFTATGMQTYYESQIDIQESDAEMEKVDAEDSDKSLVAQVMKECCQKYRYQFSQSKVVYSLAKAGRELSSDDCRAQIPSGNVIYTNLSVYAKAFRERTERKGAAVQ